MVVPYQHTDQLQLISLEAAREMMELTRRLEGILRDLYHPEGLNLGMNLGKAAGAGVAGHIHMHVLPRWVADASFMTVIGETRVLPEDLATTYKRIRAKFL
jgi:ATP adenylyltransferase